MCTPRQKKLCTNKSCDVCYGRRLATNIDIRYWIWDLNYGIDPYLVTKTSGSKRYWFYCKVCSHKYDSEPGNFIKFKGCKYCKVGSAELCKEEDCSQCFEKSLASVISDEYWVKERNGKFLPRKIRKNSEKIFWFICKLCKHIHQTSVCLFIQAKGCKYCTGSELCNDENCKQCFGESFASIIANELWVQDMNANITPRMISKHATKKFWIKCASCKHKTHRTPHNFVRSIGCQYCAGNLVERKEHLCRDENCELCFSNSFASHSMSKYWDYTSNNELTPRKVRKHSHKKCSFLCPYCNNIYVATINSITSNNTWCGCRRSKTETLVISWIREQYPQYTTITQYRLDTCPTRKFDIAIENIKIIIEIDGDQHFEQISNWQSPLDTQKIDIIKMENAISNGYTIIRLLQTDIWYNQIDWQNMLKKYIKEYDNAQCIYITSNERYRDSLGKIIDGIYV